MSEKISLLTYPFNIVVSTNSATLLEQLSEIYPPDVIQTGHHSDVFFDFTTSFEKPFWKPTDSYAFRLGSQHFRYAGKHTMLPVFEWGFNWLVSGFSCKYLCFHAAVVEKNDITLILPAPPGSGKSTMCALLMLDGWRLLSDEHCLLDMEKLEIVPFVRPISLKNNSIEVIKNSYPQIKSSRVYKDTLKGRMQYLPATAISWQNADKNARGRYVIFPKFQANSSLQTSALTEVALFERMLSNSFNYTVLGERAFHALVDWLPQLNAFDLTYSNNAEMLSWVGDLT